MPDEVIAAIIALAGVVLSVGISLMVSLLTRRYNYNQLFAETVSKNRMEWINVWRESVSTFLAIAEVLHECKAAGTSTSAESANKVNCNTCDICELKKEMLKASVGENCTYQFIDNSYDGKACENKTGTLDSEWIEMIF